MLIDDIREHVTNLYNQYEGNDLCYHNLEHTKTVVDRAMDIATNYSLSPTELFILQTGAWFHDTGHLTGGSHLHEDRSVNMMKEFMI